MFLKDEQGFGGGAQAIVFDLRSSKSLPEMIHEAGGKAVKSRVGHVFMKQAMAEHNAIFGGELSGHFYFKRNYNADSGAIAFASVMSGLAAANKPISELIAPAKRYVQSGEINFETDDKEAAIDDFKRACPKAKVDTLDGLTLDMGSWWCNMPPSNTEPLLRLNLEGPDRKTVDGLVKEVAQYLGKRSRRSRPRAGWGRGAGRMQHWWSVWAASPPAEKMPACLLFAEMQTARRTNGWQVYIVEPNLCWRPHDRQAT